MDLFGHDGALSDEVILIILQHVSSAIDFLNFAATCTRLAGLCRFEEDRYSFWRYFYARHFHLDPYELLLYKGDRDWRLRFIERYTLISKLRKSLDDDDIVHSLKLCVDAKDSVSALNALRSLEKVVTSGVDAMANMSQRFFEWRGHDILTSMISQFASHSKVALLAMKILFLVARSDTPTTDNRPLGIVKLLVDQLQSKEADNRRFALGLLWMYGGDDTYTVHFPKLGVIEFLIKYLYENHPSPIVCALSVLSKCTTPEGIQQMKSVDILPRLIELLDYQEHTIKSGAMKLLPKFDLRRVGELGAIPKLLRITTENYDRVESLAMMALIVLECLAEDDHNKVIMGKDETLNSMIMLLNCDKSELQKQTIHIIKSITRQEINARRFRQIGGLEALIHLLHKADLPDVLACVCRALIDVTADIREFVYNDSTDTCRLLESSFIRLSELIFYNIVNIVKEAAASCLASFLSAVPPSSSAAPQVSTRLVTTATNDKLPLPVIKHCFTCIVYIASYDEWLFLKDSDEVVGLFKMVQTAALDSTASAKMYLPLLAMLLRNKALSSALEHSADLQEKLLRLADDTSDPELCFYACLVLSHLLTKEIEQLDIQPWLQRIEKFTTTIPYNITWNVVLPSLQPIMHLVDSPFIQLQALCIWILAHLSISPQGRKKIKLGIDRGKLEALMQNSKDFPQSRHNVIVLEKNLSIPSVFV